MLRAPWFCVMSMSVATLAAVGCGDNVGPDADLVNADDAHLRRALEAATGGDALAAYALAETLMVGDATSCPRVDADGATITITGGCTGAIGPIVGRIVVETRGGDRSTMGLTTFETFGDGAWSFDGTVERSPAGSQLNVALATTVDGIAARSTLSLGCDERGVCATNELSWVDVDGLGFADVLGGWRRDPLGGSLTLIGASTATFDFNATVDGCIPFTLDGASGSRLCD